METLVNATAPIPAQKLISVDLPRFGECTYSDAEVIRFPWGLPGFPLCRNFLILAMSASDGYLWLQSLDDLAVAIPLCDPWSIFDDYEAPLPLYAMQSLEIVTPESFCVLCVLVAAPGAASTTINLLAPIVINLELRIGRQITLENQRYSVRTPIAHSPLANGTRS